MGPVPSSLIAIDPGIDTGMALYLNGLLHSAWPVEMPGLVIPKEARDSITFHATRYIGGPPEVIAVELPLDYGDNRKADPNDLIQLAARAGALVDHVRGVRDDIKVHWPNVSTWKSQLKKDVCHRRILSKLTTEELRVVERDVMRLGTTIRHNVMDGIGVGLWALGRFKQ